MGCLCVAGILGWDDEWAVEFSRLCPASGEPARVVGQDRERWVVQTQAGTVTTRLAQTAKMTAVFDPCMWARRQIESRRIQWKNRRAVKSVTESTVVPVLLVSGTVGVGKTSVAAEISEILSGKEVPHAYLDLDALSNSWPPQGRFNEELAFRNLASVWENFRASGAKRLIVSCVVESRADLIRFQEAVPGAALALCRLTASQATREARLRSREVGSGLEWHLNRTGELDFILDQLGIEDF